ncbi:MAG: NlpC/P60 family protein [Myxococcota bacterium]
MNALEAARRADAALSEVRRALEERYGWTHLDVTVEFQAPAQRVILHGEIAVDRIRARLVTAFGEVLPGWTIDVDDLRLLEGSTWHALPPAPTQLMIARPGSPSNEVATELRFQDGPVQCLVEGKATSIVRCRDGTVGWLAGPLGRRVSAPRLSMPWREKPGPLVRGSQAWLDVPYRLGGVTENGIDCSAFVQRLANDVLGVSLPRHSSDQLQVGPRTGPGLEPGDLVFVWSSDESPCHVGVGTGLAVVHASRSRECVVSDPLSVFLRDVRRVMHVKFADLVAFGLQVAGKPSLVAAGFELGRPVPEA